MMQAPTRDLDLEFEGYLAFLEQQDQDDQDDDSHHYHQPGAYLTHLEPPQLSQQPQLERAQRNRGDVGEGQQTASFNRSATQIEPPPNRQVPNNARNTNTPVRQSPTQQRPSQVDSRVRSVDPTARQPSAQQHPQLDRGQRSQLMQQGQRNPQTATRPQPQIHQASLPRSGNSAQGPRTTGGQLAVAQAQYQQQQLGRGASSHVPIIGTTSGQRSAQRQAELDKQLASDDWEVVITHVRPIAPSKQLPNRQGPRNDHPPRPTPQLPAQPVRTERRDANHGQNANTPNGPSSTPQPQQGQLKRKQPDSEQPHPPQRRVRQAVPGPMAPPPRPKMNVDDFPEVPRVEKIQRHLRVTYNGMDVAETTDGFWVLQQYRPPEYYLPKSSLKIPLTPTGYGPPCRFKGHTTHYSVKAPDGMLLANRVWSYETPTPGYEAIKGYVSFYARPWQSFVDGERVVPYRTDFRGGWVTKEITGVVSESTPRW